MPDEDIVPKLFDNFKKLSQSAQEFEDFRARLETRKMITDIHEVITGNGNPKKGHIFRIGVLEIKMNAIISVISITLGAIITKLMKFW